jgi:alkylhydroperoxidase family enzyme
MAESPTLLGGFVGAFVNFHGGTFTPAQVEVLLLTNSVTNAAPWPTAFHSTMALKAGVDADDVRAIRDRRLPRDPKFAALSAFTRALIERRGHLGDRDVADFTAAGFSAAQALEVIAGIAVSTMTNYAAGITQPELEEPFQPQAWKA